MENLAALASVGNMMTQMAINDQNVSFQDRTNKQNMNWQEYLIDKNRSYYLQDRQYNSPAAMMQRLQAAGLNKNLLSGGNFTGQTAPQAPATGSPSNIAPRKDAPQLDPATLSQLALNEAQRQNIEADTENKRFENSEEQRELRTRYAVALADNMGAVARQNITKADIDEVMKDERISAEDSVLSSLNAEARAKVADIYYNALMRYGKEVADWDYRFNRRYDNVDDVPALKDGHDISISRNCIAYIEKELLKLEKEGKINLNRISEVDAEIAENLKNFNTFSPFIRAFISILRLFSK